jgi:hypothetical protein
MVISAGISKFSSQLYLQQRVILGKRGRFVFTGARAELVNVESVNKIYAACATQLHYEIDGPQDMAQSVNRLRRDADLLLGPLGLCRPSAATGGTRLYFGRS